MSPERSVSCAEMERMMKVQEVDFESHGREFEVVGGSRDHRRLRPDHEAVAGALPRQWVRRTVRPPQAAAEPETDGSEDSGKGTAGVSGEILRFQRAAFLRETGRRTRRADQLYVGEDGAARSRTGEQAAAARNAPATATAAAVARDAAAHRCEQARLVWGWAVLRSDHHPGRCHQ